MRKFLPALLLALTISAAHADEYERHVISKFTPPAKPNETKKTVEKTATAANASSPLFPKEDTAIELMDKRKGTIKTNGTVWWRGANQKDALLADGSYDLKDGSNITTKGGKLIAWKKGKAGGKTGQKPAEKSPKSSPSSAHSAPADIKSDK